MTTGKNFARVAEQLRGGGWIYLVDSQGGIHQLTAEHYAELTGEQLEGSRIFTQPESAERWSGILRAGRN
jgi:hypothetical protein